MMAAGDGFNNPRSGVFCRAEIPDSGSRKILKGLPISPGRPTENAVCQSRQLPEWEAGFVETDFTTGGDFDASEVGQLA
jgi:hypothetical protein